MRFLVGLCQSHLNPPLWDLCSTPVALLRHFLFFFLFWEYCYMVRRKAVKIRACSVESFQIKVRNGFSNGKISLQLSGQHYKFHDTLNKTVERAVAGISERSGQKQDSQSVKFNLM